MQTNLAVLFGKIIFGLSRILNIGGGSAAPGLYALKIDQKLNSKLTAQIPQNIIVTGTNGKTTTARLLSKLLESQDLKVLRNSTGSNLERGVASTLISKATLGGKIKNIDIGLWETDEAAFNKLVFQIKPQVIIFLNVFRDQLDRYGEVDSVVNKWKETLSKITWNPLIIINGNDGHTLSLSEQRKVNSLIFYVKDAKFKWEKQSKLKQKASLIEAKVTKSLGLAGNKISVSFGEKSFNFTIPIPGIYHIFDFLAALCVYHSLNLPLKAVQNSIKDFTPAFGRVEKINLGGKDGFIFLIKNPAGASSVFETIAPEFEEDDRLLIALNDNFADGTDVSWIWDADFEQLSANSYQLPAFLSGRRSPELAVRLKYAGFDPNGLIVINSLEEAFIKAKQGLKGRLFILPTYTALLELQKILTKHRIKKEYWKE